MNEIDLQWNAWVEGVDAGDPPIVEYAVFIRTLFGSWREIQRSSVSSATLSDLDPDTDYEISVAAVRAGIGGTGPKSPTINVTTLCGSMQAQLFKTCFCYYSNFFFGRGVNLSNLKGRFSSGRDGASAI